MPVERCIAARTVAAGVRGTVAAGVRGTAVGACRPCCSRLQRNPATSWLTGKRSTSYSIIMKKKDLATLFPQNIICSMFGILMNLRAFSSCTHND